MALVEHTGWLTKRAVKRAAAHAALRASFEEEFIIPPIPTFVALAGDNPLDSLNKPAAIRHARLPRARASPSSVKASPRASFTISDAALTRLPSGNGRGSTNSALVDELGEIAHARLQMADIQRLRDKLTAMLEANTGTPSSAMTAVRASRQYERQMNSGQPIDVPELCRNLSLWPPQVGLTSLEQVPTCPDDSPISP